VAYLGLYGILTHRPTWYGGTALQDFVAGVQLLERSEAQTVLVDVDSPGGSVFGVEEAADALHRLRQAKRVIAVANMQAGSAAYWIASQATELVASPSAALGSIGVWMAHVDTSGAQAKAGLAVTLVAAGKYKTEGNPFEPLSGEGRAAWQRDVDHYYGGFVDAVARGRGVSAAAVRAGFGQGRMLPAQVAVRERLADRIESFDATARRVLSSTSDKTAAAHVSDALAELDFRRRRTRLAASIGGEPDLESADLRGDLAARRRRLQAQR
jgi:signal peptide peptidase SppA